MKLEIEDSERSVLEKSTKLEYALSKLSKLSQDLKLELDKELSKKDRLYSEHNNLYVMLEGIENELEDKKSELKDAIDEYIEIEKEGNGTLR